MSHDQFELLSNQAVAGSGLLYFFAVLCHLGHLALGPRSLAQSATGPACIDRDAALAGAVRSARPARAGAAPEGAADTAAPLVGQTANLLGSASIAAPSSGLQRCGVALTVVAAVVHSVAVASRGLAADPVRVPWGNMYEFTLTGTLVVTVGYLLLYRRYELSWLAPVITGFVLVTLMIAVLVLYQPMGPLRDALQSPWLVIHVIAAIVATSGFTLGGMFSMLYLLKSRWERTSGASPGATPSGYLAQLPSPARLDEIAYRTHAFAFPVWTFAALIAGPIWAHYAWGRYWGWDPKEIWAFITWVVYAAYLHARSTAGWKGNKAAAIALIGLATLWFNFVGINYFFGSGSQHSYAAPAVSTPRAVDAPGLGGGPAPQVSGTVHPACRACSQ